MDSIRSEQAQYHIAEYNKLGDSFLQNYRDSYSSVIYSVFANAIVVSWIVGSLKSQNSTGSIITIASFLPLFVSILAWALYLLRRRSMRWISQYFSLLEKQFAIEGLGWQQFYNEVSAKGFLRIRSQWVVNFICVIQVALATYFLYLVQFKL